MSLPVLSERPRRVLTCTPHGISPIFSLLCCIACIAIASPISFVLAFQPPEDLVRGVPSYSTSAHTGFEFTEQPLFSHGPLDTSPAPWRIDRRDRADSTKYHGGVRDWPNRGKFPQLVSFNNHADQTDSIITSQFHRGVEDQGANVQGNVLPRKAADDRARSVAWSHDRPVFATPMHMLDFLSGPSLSDLDQLSHYPIGTDQPHADVMANTPGVHGQSSGNLKNSHNFYALHMDGPASKTEKSQNVDNKEIAGHSETLLDLSSRGNFQVNRLARQEQFIPIRTFNEGSLASVLDLNGPSFILASSGNSHLGNIGRVPTNPTKRRDTSFKELMPSWASLRTRPHQMEAKFVTMDPLLVPKMESFKNVKKDIIPRLRIAGRFRTALLGRMEFLTHEFLQLELATQKFLEPGIQVQKVQGFKDGYEWIISLWKRLDFETLKQMNKSPYDFRVDLAKGLPMEIIVLRRIRSKSALFSPRPFIGYLLFEWMKSQRIDWLGKAEKFPTGSDGSSISFPFQVFLKRLKMYETRGIKAKQEEPSEKMWKDPTKLFDQDYVKSLLLPDCYETISTRLIILTRDFYSLFVEVKKRFEPSLAPLEATRLSYNAYMWLRKLWGSLRFDLMKRTNLSDYNYLEDLQKIKAKRPRLLAVLTKRHLKSRNADINSRAFAAYLLVEWMKGRRQRWLRQLEVMIGQDASNEAGLIEIKVKKLLDLMDKPVENSEPQGQKAVSKTGGTKRKTRKPISF